MDMIEKQKCLADRVQKVLAENGFHALLAGGAPRDWHIGKAANDLDFYIQSYDDKTASTIVQGILDVALTPLKGNDYDKMMEGEPTLLGAYETEYYDQKLQFIFTSIDPQQFVEEKFDLSICKVWYWDREIRMNWEGELSFREEICVKSTAYGDFTPHMFKVLDRGEWREFSLCSNWDHALKWITRKQEAKPRGRYAPGGVAWPDNYYLGVFA